MTEVSNRLYLLSKYGLNIENNSIRLSGEIDETTFESLELGINAFKMVKPKARNLTIVLSTYGGDLYYGFAIYDLLRACSLHITIECIGPVMSSGVVILCAADEVTTHPNTQFMMHYGSQSEGEQDFINAEIAQKHWKKLTKSMEKVISSRVKVSKRTLGSWLSKEKFLSAKEALDVGLVDRIWNED